MYNVRASRNASSCRRERGGRLRSRLGEPRLQISRRRFSSRSMTPSRRLSILGGSRRDRPETDQSSYLGFQFLLRMHPSNLNLPEAIFPSPFELRSLTTSSKPVLLRYIGRHIPLPGDSVRSVPHCSWSTSKRIVRKSIGGSTRVRHAARGTSAGSTAYSSMGGALIVV